VEVPIVRVHYNKIQLYVMMLTFQFINLGVKMFGRNESKDVECEFRLVQDVSRRVVLPSDDDCWFVVLQFCMFCICNDKM